ncbi:FtsX-like permease family protein [Kitasatospora sp. NPDC059646]|uniref:FtsX-like permease family protein n=1 Tax=Kitasatospora sp. NPDC059646 TaxID=3346893 RepID=UPI0036A71AB7
MTPRAAGAGGMLVLAELRTRWTGFLAAFLAVLAGTALITAALTVRTSAAPAVQPRLAGAAALVLPPRAVDPDGSPADRIPWSEDEAAGLLTALRADPAIAAAVADRAFYAQAFRGGRPVADRGAAEAGHGWSAAALAPYRLVVGRAPAAADEVVVAAALGVPAGSRLTVNLTAGRAEFTVTGTLDGPGYWFDDRTAAARAPGVRAIALLAAPDAGPGRAAAAARAATAGRAEVLTGAARAALQPRHLEHKRFLADQLLAAVAALALFTTAFVVAATLALHTGLRRRDLGLLRLIGAGPGRIRRMLLGEAAAVALLGSAAGGLLGLAAAPLLARLLLRLDAAPPELTIRHDAGPPLLAAAVGVAVSTAAAWASSRTAARAAPLDALLESRDDRPTGRLRTGCGLAALLAGAGAAVATATTTADDRVAAAITATAALITAAALLAPVLIGPSARALTAPLLRLRPAWPLLLRGDLTASARRAAAVAAPVIAAVGFAVLLGGTVQTMRAAYPAGRALQLAGQLIVTNDGTPGTTDEAVAANPVGKAALPVRAFVRAADGATTAVDVLGSRDPALDRPGQAVLGRTLADRLGVTAGQQYAVRFADGATVPVRIAEVLPDDPARGAFVMSRAQVRAHDPAALNDDVFVPAGAPATAVPGTAVHDALRYALDDYATDARLTDALAALLIAVATGYGALAAANGAAAAAHARRRDLAVLGTLGATRRQLLALAARESALTAGLGAALGVLVALPALAAVASGLSRATGARLGPHLHLPTLAAAVLGSLALTVTASTVTTWRTLRRR